MMGRKRIQQFIETTVFQKAIISLIIFNAITLGLETSQTVMDDYGPALLMLDRTILGIFIIEITLKLYAYRLSFFQKGWNVFDLSIICVALMPDSGALSVLRSLRILRTLRLFAVVPSMRKVVGGLFRALPGIASVSMIMLLLFYIFAVMGTKLYSATFPDWFGTLGETMYTLFQIMTLESWSMGIVRPVMETHPNAWVFFVSYILATTFTMLNLFIAVILNAMHADDEQQAQESRNAMKEAILEANAEMEARIQQRLDALETKIK